MRWFLVTLIVVHGLIHFLGFIKAFGMYDPPQLTQNIPKPWGVAWLLGGAAMLVTAVLFLQAWQAWWAAGFAAVALSQVVICSSWADAKFGTVANVLILAGSFYGFVSAGPLSFLAQ